jgi:AbrB family looped-hinge helix DNA binding protein
MYSKEVMRSLRKVKDMTAIGKITVKGQTTIPREIRDALKVKAGDLLAWDVRPSGHVEVRRVQPLDIEYLRAIEGTLSEWAGAEDEEAYRDL